MDKLAQRLKSDAKNIDATLSRELEQRIDASLAAAPRGRKQRHERAARRLSFWWASSLTGLAAATAVILLLNLRGPVPEPVTESTDLAAVTIPAVPWKTRTAVLTRPLEREYDALQEDIEKAERAVRDDLDAIF